MGVHIGGNLVEDAGGGDGDEGVKVESSGRC